jgi:transposase-like protein
MGIRNWFRKITRKENVVLHGEQCPGCESDNTYRVAGNSVWGAFHKCADCGMDFTVSYGPPGSREWTEL